MGWSCRLISTLCVSGSLVHVIPCGTIHPCRNSRAHNKLKRKYLINDSIKRNNLCAFSLNWKFQFMVDVWVVFGGEIGFVAGP